MNRMDAFRPIAQRIDQRIHQLAAQGVTEPDAVIEQMIAYIPDLQKIWEGTSDDQLIALSDEFPGFYLYGLIMEKAAEAEREKTSRPSNSLPEFSEAQKQIAIALLTTAANLERDYTALSEPGKARVNNPMAVKLGRQYRQWRTDTETFTRDLRVQGADAKTLIYVDEVFGRLAESIGTLAKK